MWEEECKGLNTGALKRKLHSNISCTEEQLLLLSFKKGYGVMRSSNVVKILSLVTIMKDSSAVPGTFIRSRAAVKATKTI